MAVHNQILKLYIKRSE